MVAIVNLGIHTYSTNQIWNEWWKKQKKNLSIKRILLSKVLLWVSDLSFLSHCYNTFEKFENYTVESLLNNDQIRLKWRTQSERTWRVEIKQSKKRYAHTYTHRPKTQQPADKLFIGQKLSNMI